jgi:hypothetical protein
MKYLLAFFAVIALIGAGLGALGGAPILGAVIAVTITIIVAVVTVVVLFVVGFANTSLF